MECARLARARVLKPSEPLKRRKNLTSARLARARVLKLEKGSDLDLSRQCPPRAGTCVETSYALLIDKAHGGARLARARVLKQWFEAFDD